jgi:hypothetical protein
MNQSKIILEPMEDLERRLKEELEKNKDKFIEFYAFRKHQLHALNKIEYCILNNDLGAVQSLQLPLWKYIGFCIANPEIEVAPSRYAKEPSQDEVKAFDAGYEKGYQDALNTRAKPTTREVAEAFSDGYQRGTAKHKWIIDIAEEAAYQKGYDSALVKMRAAIVTAEKGE